MRRSSFSASVLLVVVAGCAPKRQAELSTLPVPLVSALIDDRGSPTRPSPAYAVGHLPPAYPAALTPTGPVRVVGGMTKGDETVVIFEDSTRRLAAVMEQVFEQHGYTRPQPTRGSGFMSGSGPYSFFCNDSGTVSVEPLSGVNRAAARVTYRRTQGRGYCPTEGARLSVAELVLPELKAPAGVHVSGASGGANSEGISSSAQMTGTNLSAPTILSHYAAQLLAAGWTADAPAVSPRVAAQYVAAKDTSGGAWEGVLMASGGASAMTVSVNMHRRGTR